MSATTPRARLSSGQSVVEFALVIPIVLILFVGIADLGRVFNAGVVLEAATRNAAEHGAQQYLARPPGDPSTTAAVKLSAPAVGDASYYAAIRDEVARVACAEMRGLPSTDFAAGTCPTWPIVAVCVHDGADPGCGSTATSFASIPPECGALSGVWSNAATGSGERWVEVRACYRFSSLLKLQVFSFGDIYLQRTRSFIIPCYFATGFGGCG